jgi:hypothetical protein
MAPWARVSASKGRRQEAAEELRAPRQPAATDHPQARIIATATRRDAECLRRHHGTTSGTLYPPRMRSSPDRHHCCRAAPLTFGREDADGAAVRAAPIAKRLPQLVYADIGSPRRVSGTPATRRQRPASRNVRADSGGRSFTRSPSPLRRGQHTSFQPSGNKLLGATDNTQMAWRCITGPTATKETGCRPRLDQFAPVTRHDRRPALRVQ